MAASPFWKVYNASGEYRAACKAVEEAAVLVAFLGRGATIRCDHAWIVWTEGGEDKPAAESYDYVAEVAMRRLDERRRELAIRRAKGRCTDCGATIDARPVRAWIGTPPPGWKPGDPRPHVCAPRR